MDGDVLCSSIFGGATDTVVHAGGVSRYCHVVVVPVVVVVVAVVVIVVVFLVLFTFATLVRD